VESSPIRWGDSRRAPGTLLAPVLACLYFPLALAADAGDLVRIRDLALPIARPLGVGASGWVLGYWAARDARKAAVVSSLVVTAFATFGYLHRLITAGRIPLIGRELVLLGVVAGVVACTLLAVPRSRRTFEPLLRFLSMVGILLVGFSVVRLAGKIRGSEMSAATLTRSAITVGAGPIPPPPDIYLIVPDKYTGPALLQANYGYDDNDFVPELKRRGFVVPAAARANYTHTFLSLASMLNLRYLDDLPHRFGEANSDWTATYPMIEENELAAFLKGRGYEFVFFPTAFGATRENRFADVQLPLPEVIRSELVVAWYRTTGIPALGRLCRRLGCPPGPPYVPETAEMLAGQLGHLERREKPLFVLAHLTLRHEPYLFWTDCRQRPGYWPDRDDGADSAAIKAAYVEQIECVNRKLLTAVDSILFRSHGPPVILIQADHGHGRLGRLLPPLADAPAAKVAERLSLFAAYHLPGGDQRLRDTCKRDAAGGADVLSRRSASAFRCELLVLRQAAVRVCRLPLMSCRR
jgi:hypothetical protein